ncbi:MAG: hypothetical protein ACLR23_19705 [Clostridia bacterium]
MTIPVKGSYWYKIGVDGREMNGIDFPQKYKDSEKNFSMARNEMEEMRMPTTYYIDPEKGCDSYDALSPRECEAKLSQPAPVARGHDSF